MLGACRFLFCIKALVFLHRRKNPACNAGGLDSVSGLGRSPGGGHGDPL